MDAVVLCTLGLPEPAPSLLAAVAELRVLGRLPSTDELAAELRRGVDVLCSQLRDPVTPALLDAGRPRLRCVSNYAVGFDNVDIEAATERGIVVGNTPGVLTDATADCALGLILAAARRLREGDAAVRAGTWGGWEPTYLLGLHLHDALLGLVGFGRIGQALARRALACGMRVAYADPAARVSADLVGRVEAVDLDRLVESADVLSLHVPLSAETHHLVDAELLRRMRPTAVLVNTSRGPVVDEAALARALSEGWIAAAGLDVYEQEPRVHPDLLACANVVLAPHLGSATTVTRAAMAEICARNAIAALEGRIPGACVNPGAWATAAPPSLLEGG